LCYQKKKKKKKKSKAANDSWYGANQVKNKSKSLNQQNKEIVFLALTLPTLSEQKKVCLLHRSARLSVYVSMCVCSALQVHAHISGVMTSLPASTANERVI